MGFPPEAFLIGAQKAGTTYLARLLDQQPGIALSSPKEPGFFAGQWERGPDWYRSCFPADDTRVFLDASPSYSSAPLHLDDPATADRGRSRFAGVPARIRSVSPHARFIYILREPVDRAWSAYWHQVRNEGESREFGQALEHEPGYLNASDYLGQIRQYQSWFPLERFLFMRFEDLRERPERELARCLAFLGIADHAPARFGEVGQHSGYRPGRVARLVNRIEKSVPGAARARRELWSRLPAGARGRLRARFTRPIPRMDPLVRARLQEHFRPMLEPLMEVTGLDLRHWCVQAPESGIGDTPSASTRVAGGARS